MKRLRILVSAYACSPYQGSEPGVGWGYISALAAYHDLWVLVEKEKFQSDIEKYLSENPESLHNVHFHFISKRRNRALRKIWPPSYYWYYRKWHQSALELARNLHREVHFDLVHQLTMVSFREPGYLWQLGIPFVWGPIGGMDIFPWRFLGHVGLHGAIFYFFRNVINLFQMKFLKRPQLAACSSGKGLIAATSENYRRANWNWKVSGTILSEIGIPQANRFTPQRRSENDRLRIIWSGLHISRKAFQFGLFALAKLPQKIKWELNVLGDGPLRSRWERLADKLGLSDRIHFHGKVTRECALSLMTNGHIMLITSLSDLTSTVTIESLSLGLPVICPDHCGFRDAVNETSGIRVSVDTPKGFIKGLSEAIAYLDGNEDQRYKLAQGALMRSRDFEWGKKVKTVNEIYVRVVGL